MAIQQRLKRKIHTKSTIECNYSMLSNARRCRFAVRRNASHNKVKLLLKLNSPFYQSSSILKDEKLLLITVLEDIMPAQ